jgi:hypothetical protein
MGNGQKLENDSNRVRGVLFRHISVQPIRRVGHFYVEQHLACYFRQLSTYHCLVHRPRNLLRDQQDWRLWGSLDEVECDAVARHVSTLIR